MLRGIGFTAFLIPAKFRWNGLYRAWREDAQNTQILLLSLTARDHSTRRRRMKRRTKNTRKKKMMKGRYIHTSSHILHIDEAHHVQTQSRAMAHFELCREGGSLGFRVCVGLKKPQWWPPLRHNQSPSLLLLHLTPLRAEFVALDSTERRECRIGLSSCGNSAEAVSPACADQSKVHPEDYLTILRSFGHGAGNPVKLLLVLW